MDSVLLVDAPAVHVRRVTPLNRPDQHNAMTAELCEALHHELSSIASDRTCRVVVPHRRAGRGFLRRLRSSRVTGRRPETADTTEPRERRGNQEHMSISGILKLRALPQPVIAWRSTVPRRGSDWRFTGVRHSLRQSRSRVPRGVHQHRCPQLRHGDQLAPSPPDRCIVPGHGADATGRKVDAAEALRIGLSRRRRRYGSPRVTSTPRGPSRSRRSRRGAGA